MRRMSPAIPSMYSVWYIPKDPQSGLALQNIAGTTGYLPQKQLQRVSSRTNREAISRFVMAN